MTKFRSQLSDSRKFRLKRVYKVCWIEIIMKKMVKKEVKDSKEKIINLESVILFVMFLAIGIIFYISLGRAKPNVAEFGIVQIIFSVVFAFFVTGILVWTKNITMTNPYLGSVCGMIAIVALEYGFYLGYRGFYSRIFMVAAGIVVLIYLGRNFFKYRKSSNIDEDEE